MLKKVAGSGILLLGCLQAVWIIFNISIQRTAFTNDLIALPAIVLSLGCIYVGYRWMRGLPAERFRSSFEESIGERDGWPVFANNSRPILMWVHPKGSERVLILERNDGMFSVWPERWRDDEGGYWTEIYPHASLYGTEDDARRGVIADFPWAKDVPPERPMG